MKYLNALLWVLVLCLSVRAAPEDRPAPSRTISVSGSAIGYIPSDTILWDVTLQATGKDVVDAKRASDDQAKSLLDDCARKGIQATDIAVGIVRIQDTRTGARSAAGDPDRPFAVQRTMTVRQRDPRLFQEILELLGRASDTRTKYTVVSSKADQVTRETLVKATQAARDKAAAMAGALGARLGNVLTINEYPPAGCNAPAENIPTDQSMVAFGADAEKIQIAVFVTFELQ